MTPYRNIINIVTGPRPLFILLPLLMILLIVGTIAQKYIGIYQAQHLYFSSLLTWIGPIPFPGGLTLIGLFAINLLGKFLFRSQWTVPRIGINVAHFGVIVLVFGGLMTALTAREGYLVLEEDQTKAVIEDYHDRVLTIRDGATILTQYPLENLHNGFVINDSQIPFTMTVDLICHNCGITRRDEANQAGWTIPGKFMQLNNKTSDVQDEKNMAGVEFHISGAGTADGKYLTFDKFPKPPQIKKDGRAYTITVERAQRPLPFNVTLTKFQEDLHPGTDMARAFTSDIMIDDHGTKWPARIAMNEPLRYKGMTIYQTSFDLSGTPTSVFSVVENKGRIFPYLASALIALGLIWHVLLRLKVLPRSLSLFAALLLLHPAIATADTANTVRPLNMNQFAELPILQDGRIKPLDSFARIELKKFSGHDHTKEQSAVQWIATALFDPASAIEEPVFYVPNANIRHQLGLAERKTALYSLTDLSGGLQKTAGKAQEAMGKPAKDLDADSNDLLRIHEHALEFTQILRSFSSILPLNITLDAKWMQKAGIKKGDKITYQKLQKIAPDVETQLRQLIKRKGENPEKYTSGEQQLALLGMQLRTMADAGAGNNLLRVLRAPNLMNKATDWVAPWELMNNGKGSPATSAILQHWGDAANAWQLQNAKNWDSSIAALTTEHTPRLTLEILYNRFSPFMLAIGLYTLGFALSLGTLANPSKLLARSLMPVLLAGVAAQGFGLLARVIIMGRPPVGTLYESLLFVGLVAPLLSLLFNRKLGAGLGYLIASLTGIMVGLLAFSLAGDEDTMKVLTAVLNTQFWLATHVLCITMGYGWCLVTSMLAHVILVGDATGRLQKDMRTSLLRTLQLLTIFSLLFTAVGTILGGIWADQSWGRFWGWDPKENGALLIVLWIVWVLHSKISGHLSERNYIMALAFLSFIVYLAWIGVNLLGVGLHSYGFMEGVFWGLGLFGAAEITLISICGFIAAKRSSHAA